MQQYFRWGRYARINGQKEKLGRVQEHPFSKKRFVKRRWLGYGEDTLHQTLITVFYRQERDICKILQWTHL